MAKDKNSFLLYCDLIHTVKKLTDEQAGELFKHILSYVNDENPEAKNGIIDIAFEPIKQQLKRDLKKYEKIRTKRSEAGKASAEKRKQIQQVLTSVESVEQTSTNPTVSVSDSVSDSVSVNDSVTVSDSESFKSSSKEEGKPLSKKPNPKNLKTEKKETPPPSRRHPPLLW